MLCQSILLEFSSYMQGPYMSLFVPELDIIAADTDGEYSFLIVI